MTSHGSKPPKTGLHNIIPVTKYSTLFKLLAVTAYVLRFVFNCHQQPPKKGTLSAEELLRAKMAWIADCQQQVYWLEQDCLKRNTYNKEETSASPSVKGFLRFR